MPELTVMVAALLSVYCANAYAAHSLGLTAGLWGQWYDFPRVTGKDTEQEESVACPQRHRQEVLRLWWMKLGIMGPPPVLSTTYGTPLQSKPVSHRMPRLSVSLYLCLLFNHCNYLMRWFCNECFRDEDMEPQKKGVRHPWFSSF